MNQLRRRTGSVIVLTVVLMAVMFACLALALDMGYLYAVRTELQAAADAGALAGAAIIGSETQDPETIARDFAELNAAGGSNVSIVPNRDIEVGVWDDDTQTFQPVLANSPDADAVRVTCRRDTASGNPVQLFFARVLGQQTGDVSASAIARARISVCGQIVGLERIVMSGTSYTDSFKSELGPYSPGAARDNGDVCSNGTIYLGSSTQVKGAAHPGPGYTVVGGGNVTQDSTPLGETISLPPVDFGDAATINDNGTIPMSDNGRNPIVGGQFVLFGADHVELTPGVYYFTQMTLAQDSAVTLTGPTQIYVTGNCYLSGGSVANTTQAPGNLQLFSTGSTCSLSGDSEFYGFVYAPTARVVRTGSSDYYGAIMAREILVSGSGGIHADESLKRLPRIPPRPILVQ